MFYMCGCAFIYMHLCEYICFLLFYLYLLNLVHSCHLMFPLINSFMYENFPVNICIVINSFMLFNGVINFSPSMNA